MGSPTGNVEKTTVTRENNCEKNNDAWTVAATVLIIILLILFLWGVILQIILVDNPVWVKTINMGQDEPDEDAPPDVKMAAVYAAIIDVGLCVIIGIIFGCTRCWNTKSETKT